MTREQAQAIVIALFGVRNGDGAIVERNPEACAVLRVVHPEVKFGQEGGVLNTDFYAVLRQWAGRLAIASETFSVAEVRDETAIAQLRSHRPSYELLQALFGNHSEGVPRNWRARDVILVADPDVADAVIRSDRDTDGLVFAANVAKAARWIGAISEALDPQAEEVPS